MILFCHLVSITVSVLFVPHAAGQFSNETTNTAKESLLLQLFGLTLDMAPDSKPVNPPDYMIELFHKVSDENGWVTHPDAIHGNHIHSFLHRGGENQSILLFKVSNILHTKERILRADLVLFQVHSSSSMYKFPKPVTVVVEIIDISTNAIVSVQLVPTNKVGWHTFPIGLRQAENWLQNRSAGNVSLMLRVKQSALGGKAWNPPVPRFARGESRMKSKQPMLVVYCDDPSLGKKPRVTTSSTSRHNVLRRSGRATDRNSKSACRRHKMFVDFAALGWNSWVIAPPFYSAFHCAGRCSQPINSGQSDTTIHAFVQAELAFLSGSDVDEPCCVPVQLSGISLLYYEVKDKKSIEFKLMSNMVVEKCACR